MYYTSHLDVLCGLCNQVARTGYVAELESKATMGLQEKTMFENLLKGCQQEIELLQQHIMQRQRDCQVSKVGFSLIKLELFIFVLPF
jgi:hypothetical protein